MSRHINTHINTAIKDSVFFNILNYTSSVSSRMYALSIFPITFVIMMFILNNQMIDNDRLKTIITDENIKHFDSITGNTFESISDKLKIIMDQLCYRGPYQNFALILVIFIFGFIISIIPQIAEILRNRFGRSFVVLNDHTKTKSEKYSTKNEKLKWVVISAVIGIPSALITGYIKGIFTPQ